MRLRGGTRVFPDGTRLTPRQEEVIRLVGDGLTNGEIAERLGITLDGAKFHITEIMNRFGVHSREDAVRAWKQNRRGLLGLPIGGAPLLAGAGVVGVAFVIAAVFVVAWPGGDENVWASAVHRAAEAASDSSARFTMEFTLQKPGEPAQPSQVATGEIDFRQNRMRVTPIADGYEQIFANGKSYQRAGPNQLWREFDSSSSNPTASFTPAYWFDQMKSAKNVVRVGTEVVRGETATIYTFTTPYPTTVPEVQKIYAHTELEYKVWLADGRLLRMEQHSEFVGTGDPELDGQQQFMRIDLDGWNEPVNIEVPGPGEIER